jgi:hypothetical protein
MARYALRPRIWFRWGVGYDRVKFLWVLGYALAAPAMPAPGVSGYHWARSAVVRRFQHTGWPEEAPETPV